MTCVFTNLGLGTTLSKFVRVSCTFGLYAVARLTSLRAEDVRNNVASSNGDVARLHSKRNLYVWLTFSVGVVFGTLAESLVNDELVELDLAGAHVLSSGGEILVYALDNNLRRFARKDLVQDILRNRL